MAGYKVKTTSAGPRSEATCLGADVEGWRDAWGKPKQAPPSGHHIFHDAFRVSRSSGLPARGRRPAFGVSEDDSPALNPAPNGSTQSNAAIRPSGRMAALH